MPNRRKEVTPKELATQTARAVLIAPDINPKTGQVYSEEVVFTLRPGWSKVGKYEPALPGGKIEAAAGDFEGIVDEALDDPYLIITMEQMIVAGLHAVEREISEELGIIVAPGLLGFVDVSTNPQGWTTYSYAAELPEKPTLLVKPESAGTRWISVQRLLEGKPKLLSGHLGIARRALQSLKGK